MAKNKTDMGNSGDFTKKTSGKLGSEDKFARAAYEAGLDAVKAAGVTPNGFVRRNVNQKALVIPPEAAVFASQPNLGAGLHM